MAALWLGGRRRAVAGHEADDYAAWPRNITELTALVQTRLRRMQYRPGLLDGFLATTRLGLTPFGNPAIEDR